MFVIISSRYDPSSPTFLISAHRKILASFCYTNVIADYTPSPTHPPQKKKYIYIYIYIYMYILST
jgi:hypothetical protein